MASSGPPLWPDPTPIAELQPTTETGNRSVVGIVTLIWPYSASQGSYSFLLVEPDFRLRRQKGQVRLRFSGSSAKAVAKGGIKSGDKIILGLEDVQWAKDQPNEIAQQSPGRSIEWELCFGERVLLQIQREDQQAIIIKIDHPPASPTRTPSQSPPQPTPPPETTASLFARPAPLSNGVSSWSSPAFLKRKAPSSTSYFNALRDPFKDDNDYREVSPTKRTKFGRKSAEWRFTERTPSPVLQLDFQLEQQIEQQVEQEILRSRAPQQEAPPTPVSELAPSTEEHYTKTVEQIDQSPNPDTKSSLRVLELKAILASPDGQNVKAQGESKDQELDPGNGERLSKSGPLQPEQVQEVIEAQIEGPPTPRSKYDKAQTTQPHHVSHPERIPSAIPTNGRSPSLIQNLAEPSSRKVTPCSDSSHSVEDRNQVGDDDPEGERDDSPFSQKDAQGNEHFDEGEMIMSTNQTSNEYLRQSAAGRLSSSSKNLEDNLRTSNQGPSDESGRDDQKASRVSPASVIELSSSSPIQAPTNPQESVNSHRLDLQEDHDLASDEYFSEVDYSDDGEGDDQTTDEENELAKGDVQVDNISFRAIDASLPQENDDLSELDYSVEEVASLSDEKEKEDESVQALHEMLDDEERASRLEDEDGIKEDVKSISSDSDVVITNGASGRSHLRSPTEMRDTTEDFHEGEGQAMASHGPSATSPDASNYGYDGSSVSRLNSVADAIQKSNDPFASSVKVSPVRDTGAMTDMNSEHGSEQVVFPHDHPIHHEGMTHIGANEASRARQSPIKERFESVDAKDAEISPKSVAWAAFDEFQREAKSEPPPGEVEDGLKQSIRVIPPRSSSVGHSSTQLRSTPAFGQELQPIVSPTSIAGPQDKDFQEDYDMRAVRSPAKQGEVYNTNTPPSEEAKSTDEVEKFFQSEAEDYWDEADELSDEEALPSDFDEQGLDQDGNSIEYTKSRRPQDEAFQQLEDSVGKKFPIKSSRVEIIDLESTDEDEPTVPPERTDSRTASLHPLPVQSRDETGALQAAPARDTGLVAKDGFEQLRIFEASTTTGQDLLVGEDPADQRPHLRSGSYSPVAENPRREVHDTYSEDAGFTESELADTRSLSPDREDYILSQTTQTARDQDAERIAEQAMEPTLRQIEKLYDDRPSPNAQAIHHSSDAKREVTASLPESDTDLIGSQLMVRTLRPRLEEIPDSVMQNQHSVTVLEAEIEKTSSMMPIPTPHDLEPRKDVIEMEQDGAPVRLDIESSEECTQEYGLEDLRDELEQRTQLLTPTTTQVTRTRSGLPEPSLENGFKNDPFPTPNLTQKTSDIIPPINMQDTELLPGSHPESSGRTEREHSLDIMKAEQAASQTIAPETPAPSRKVSLVQKLKEMKSESEKRQRSSLINDTSSTASPWFSPRRSSRLAPHQDQEPANGTETETDREGDVSSEVGIESQSQIQPSLPRYRASSPFARPHLSRLPSSSPPPQLTKTDSGFRTSLSYFAPLNTLRSHYNRTTSVLALVIAPTAIERATTGPKDYHTTLYITDPSSSDPPSVTSARIFRPSKFSFPNVEQGDAVLLRNFRIMSFRKKLGLLSTDSSAWTVFRRGEEPQTEGPPVEFGAEERGFARGLWDWWATVEKKDFTDAVPSDQSTTNRSPKTGRGGKGGKGRAPILTHELRDGTTYIDRGKSDEDDSVHELRDGTRWSDSKL